MVMNNKQHTRNFTRSDDALILEQPVTRHRPQDTGKQCCIPAKRESCVGLTNSAFRWPSVMIMTGLSTRERSVHETRRPATRTAEAGTRRPEVNCAAIDTRASDGGFQNAVAWRMNCAHGRRLRRSWCRLIQLSADPFSHGATADETLKFSSLITGIFVFNPGKPHCHIAPEALGIFEFVRI